MPTSSFEIEEILRLRQYTDDFSCFGKGYLLTRIKSEMLPSSFMNNVFRFKGLTFLLGMKGMSGISINLNHYDINSNSIILFGPETIVSPEGYVQGDFDCSALFISIDFMRDVNFDLNVINYHSLKETSSPVHHLTDDEMKLIGNYLHLLHRTASSGTESVYVKSIARNLVAALVYQVLDIIMRKKTPGEKAAVVTHSRKSHYVREFMQAVGQNYKKERSVGFYADKLYISPKYLSLLIKEATGRSASAWIDDYVMLEAKNLLRFSGKNIQQIAYELNFTNQSSFGKYFKNLAGMSPSEFQRS